MIRYYKLFDLLNRRNMNKSDLLEILSSKTIAKLSKGANMNTDVIDKICLYLQCQPSDIMEVVVVEEILDDTSRILALNTDEGITQKIFETSPRSLSMEESDEKSLTTRTYIKEDI